MGEDAEQDAFHGGSVLEDPHGAGSAAHLAEAALDGAGATHGLALLEGFVTEAGEQLVEVVPQALDRFRVDTLPTVGTGELFVSLLEHLPDLPRLDIEAYGLETDQKALNIATAGSSPRGKPHRSGAFLIH